MVDKVDTGENLLSRSSLQGKKSRQAPTKSKGNSRVNSETEKTLSSSQGFSCRKDRQAKNLEKQRVRNQNGNATVFWN